MTKAELVKTINDLALKLDKPMVTMRPRKATLETILVEYQDDMLEKISRQMDMPVCCADPNEPVVKKSWWKRMLGI